MTFEESLEAFLAAQATDPDCALAYWGAAMTHVHPLWADSISPAALVEGDLAAATAYFTELLANCPSPTVDLPEHDEPDAYSKLNTSSSSGGCMPCSKYSRQMWSHGRAYMSGTSNSITVPGLIVAG